MRRSRALKGNWRALTTTIVDAPPTCATTTVTITLKMRSGHIICRVTSGVRSVNRAIKVSLRLTRSLKRATYYLYTMATDTVDNGQRTATRARLTVK